MRKSLNENYTLPEKINPLPRSFYNVSPERLARRLLGTYIVRYIGSNVLVARIVEAEAYNGANDPASHAFGGMTGRNKPMFEEGGISYVYFIYGMHFCFNVVAGRTGDPGAVLVRAAEPLEGIPRMMRNRKKKYIKDILGGPAKICQALEINNELNGHYLGVPPLILAYGKRVNNRKVGYSSRIGITRGKDIPWRYFEIGSEYLSRV